MSKITAPLSVPTSYHWIAIPVQPVERVIVEWLEDFRPRSATYFRCTGYWGPLRANSSPKMTGNGPEGQGPVCKPDDHVDPQGTVDVYIAAHFVLPNFRNGPLKAFHLQSLAGTGDSTQWISMELNECFEYGQNTYYKGKDRIVRFIVYHPSVVPGGETPDIFQHRFTGTRADGFPATMDELAEMAPKENFARLTAQMGVKAISGIFQIGKALRGDWLHSFLDRKHRQKFETLAKERHDVSDALSQRDWMTVLAQLCEAEEVEVSNEASEQEVENRAKAAAAAMKMVAKEKSLIKEITKLLNQPNATEAEMLLALNPVEPAPSEAQKLTLEPDEGDKLFTGVVSTDLVIPGQDAAQVQGVLTSVAHTRMDRLRVASRTRNKVFPVGASQGGSGLNGQNQLVSSLQGGSPQTRAPQEKLEAPPNVPKKIFSTTKVSPGNFQAVAPATKQESKQAGEHSSPKDDSIRRGIAMRTMNTSQNPL